MIAEYIYRGTMSAKNQVNETPERFVKRLLAKYETINKRLKHFQVLKQRFRHSLSYQSSFYFALAINTQLIVVNEDTIFDYVYFK